MVKVYSNGCPLCEALKKKLQDNNLEFTEEHNEEEMGKIGIKAVPMLLTESGELLNYKESLQWLKRGQDEQN